MITKDSILDAVTLRSTGVVEIRRSNRILDDGVVISQTYHRSVIMPNDVIDPNTDPTIRAVALLGRALARK